MNTNQRRIANSLKKVIIFAEAKTLMSHIFYWWRKAALRQGGTVYITKSTAEWIYQVALLTPGEFEKALRHLKKRELIEVTQFSLGRKAITQVTLGEAGLALNAALLFPVQVPALARNDNQVTP